MEKGSGAYGRFELVDENDPRYRMLIENSGREAQLRAMDRPEPYDSETQELVEWFASEVKARGKDEMLERPFYQGLLNSTETEPAIN